MAILTSNCFAIYWSSSVTTNSSSWYIYRQSNNISFNLSSSVEGNISPIDYHGRVLSPYHAYYAEIGTNDVRLRDRTSALAGSYKSNDEIKMQSEIIGDVIDVSVVKSPGSNIYKISFNNEQWPVILMASRTIRYSGQQINDRDFEGNNGDFVGASFLYSQELSKEQRSVMWLQRMNATVLATNDSILQAEFKPTKYLGYLIKANNTGIADLSYRFRDSQYDVKRQIYPALSEGDERYFGESYLSRKIEMKSLYETLDEEDIWLSCCYGGWNDMKYLYRALRGFA